MTEAQEAKKLAEWIGGEPGKTIPSVIDEGVVECIIALRPEFALPARIQIDEILASLTEGPLVDPGIATALQSWIEAEPGTPPPPILPIGIVEATYALRPELAPAPRVSIDDILQSVTTGPLASSPTPAIAGVDPVISLVDERTKRRWWAGPTVGALAVAAIVLVFVQPIAHKTNSSDHNIEASLESAIASDASENQPILIGASFKTTEKDKEIETMNQSDRADSALSLRTKKQPESVQARPPSIRKRPTTRTAPPAATSPQPVAPLQIQMTEDAGFADSMLMGAAGGAQPIPRAKAEAPQASSRSASKSRSRSQSRRASRSATEGGLLSMAAAKKETTSIDFDSVEVEDDLEKELVEMAEEEPPVARSRMSGNDVIVQAAIQRAKSLLVQDKPTEALATLEQALLLDTNNPFLKAKVWRTKAKALDALGHATEAKQARETAAKLDPAR
jgi:tetratricopeptide (TPR) repeat protein